MYMELAALFRFKICHVQTSQSHKPTQLTNTKLLILQWSTLLTAVDMLLRFRSWKETRFYYVAVQSERQKTPCRHILMFVSLNVILSPEEAWNSAVMLKN